MSTTTTSIELDRRSILMKSAMYETSNTRVVMPINSTVNLDQPGVRIPKLAVRNRVSEDGTILKPGTSSQRTSASIPAPEHSDDSFVAISGPSATEPQPDLKGTVDHAQRARTSDSAHRSSGSRSSNGQTFLNIDDKPVKRKKTGSLVAFLTLKEPSTKALQEFAEAEKDKAKQKGVDTSSVGLPGVSKQKLPDYVPKVNSKWDGLPESASRKSSDKSKRSSTMSASPRHSRLSSPSSVAQNRAGFHRKRDSEVSHWASSAGHSEVSSVPQSPTHWRTSTPTSPQPEKDSMSPAQTQQLPVFSTTNDSSNSIEKTQRLRSPLREQAFSNDVDPVADSSKRSSRSIEATQSAVPADDQSTSDSTIHDQPLDSIGYPSITSAPVERSMEPEPREETPASTIDVVEDTPKPPIIPADITGHKSADTEKIVSEPIPHTVATDFIPVSETPEKPIPPHYVPRRPSRSSALINFSRPMRRPVIDTIDDSAEPAAVTGVP